MNAENLNHEGLTCPVCHSTTLDVKDTRPGKDFIRRRRRCAGCGYRITTKERIVDDSGDVTLVLSNGRQVSFNLPALDAVAREVADRMSEQVKASFIKVLFEREDDERSQA